MDIKQLLYFLTIAEEASISKAAEKLHMAQPPLSQQLKTLEDELGVKLVDRNTRKFEITDIGELVQCRAKQVLEMIDRTKKEVNDMKYGLTGILKIGTVSSAGATLLPDVLFAFHEKYPEINFEIVDEDTYKIIELLKSGLIDIGIIRTPFNLEMLEAINLPSVPMIAVIKKGLFPELIINEAITTEISASKHLSNSTVSLSAFKNSPLIVQHRYQKHIEELCHSTGYEPRIICSSNDVRTVLLWASAGMGIAFVPKDCTCLFPDSSLDYLEIDEPSLYVGTAIIWSKEHYQTSATSKFLEAIKTYDIR